MYRLPRLPRRTAALALLVVLPLTACSDDGQTPVDPATAAERDFLGGTCLVLAADVITLRRFAVQTLAEDPERAAVGLADVDRLAAAADRLRQGLPRAGVDLVEPLTELVAALDDLGSGGPPAVVRLRDGLDAVTRVCT